MYMYVYINFFLLSSGIKNKVEIEKLQKLQRNYLVNNTFLNE